MKFRSLIASGIALTCIAASVPTSPAEGQIGVAGRVVDRKGRSLPFVVVTSRTGNGFLSVYTDLDGRFAFPARPHRRGNTIEFRSNGFEPYVFRVDADGGDIEVTLDSVGGSLGAEWAIGLGRALDVQLLSVDGSATDPMKLRMGETYRLRVVSLGRSGCSRSGPSAFNVDGTRATLAVADFVRNRDCGAGEVEHERMFEAVFDQTGRGSIRVVGRHEDVVIPIFVIAGQTRGR